MKTVKVKIYKDPAGQGRYINKTSQFLEKAKYGMEKKATEDDITNTILDELTMDPDPDSIAYKLQGLYGLDYNTALNKITEVQDILYKEGTGESKNTVDAMVPETVVDDNRANRYNYGLNETSVVDDANYEGNTGWEDDESMEPDDLAQEDEAGLSIEKTGGAIGKRKFVKKLVRGLKKAAEGMQQDESSSASILDTPVDGRQTFINTFRRGIKDLGNEYYAKEIYSKMQTPPTPQMPMQQQASMFAQNGAQVGDPENFAHHLLALSEANSKIFDQPMNQIHGAGFENTQEPMPIAQRGREQRQADRQTRNVNKDFNRAFGDMAAGYFGVPGMPNYMQVISPQMMQAPTGNPAGQPGQSGQSGPLIDLEYKKGPWWKGTREWSAKGVPMQMMMGAGAGMPGFGYMPQMQGYNTGSSYGNSRTFPGEVIRTKSRILNEAADPAKNNDSGDLKNSGTTVELLPQEMGTASGASVDRYNLELISSPTKPGVYYGKDASGVLYQFTGNIGEHQVGKEPVGRIAPSDPSYFEVIDSIYKKAYGGAISNPGRDEYGNLEKFIYGDAVNQSIEPIISYDDNDMQSKNTQDPYYSRGGMFKYQGPNQSQVTPGTKGSPLTPQELELARKYGINDPGFDIEGARNTIRSRQREEWIDGQMSGANNSGANRGYPQTGQQGYNNQGYRQSYGQQPMGYGSNRGYGYPTAPSPGQQIKDMFSIWKRNPYTGSKTDFTWLSQNGLPRTMDGQVYQPQGQQGQTQNQKVAEVIDEYGNKKLMPLDQAEREGLSHKEVPAPKGTMGQQNPMQAGYVQDYKYTKGPWFGGNKKTLSVTNRWMDPNNPNGGTSANTGQFNNGQGPIAFPGSNAAPGTNTGTQQTNTPPVSPGAPPATPMGSAPVADTQERLSRRETLNNALDGNTRRGVKEYGPDTVNFTQARKQWEQSRADWKALPGDNNDYYKANVEPVADKMAQYDKSTDDYEANTSNRDKRKNFRDWKQGVLSEREYGGYVPDYDNLYKFQGPDNSQVDFSGTGPSNPNNSLINNGGIHMGGTGPCTEFEVSDPNSPCYDPSYLAKKASSANPQDFTVDYDINEAKTLNTTGIANLAGLGASAVQGVSAVKDNIYNDNLLAANTTSDNREATNELDYRGGYSGLNQRIMSKGQGRGSTGFNGIVGNASFVKQGGQAGYSKGGVYDLTQEQIGAILAAGGQIEFI